MPLFCLCGKLLLKLLDNFVITMMAKNQSNYYVTARRILDEGNGSSKEFREMNKILEGLIDSGEVQIMEKCGGPPYRARLPKMYWSRDRIEYIFKKWRKEREGDKDGPTEYYLGEERNRELQVKVIKI